MKTQLQSLFLLLFLVLAQTSQAQVALVAGAKSAATPVTPEQAASVFLGKSDQLPGIGTVLLIDLPENSTTRDYFYSKAAGKSPSQVRATWSRLVFSGKGVPPKEIASSAEVKKLASANPNVIGYIEKSAVDANVKVLLMVE
ncbi:MAG: hypothetical protein ACOYNF_05935 [Rhodoferax sp.]